MSSTFAGLWDNSGHDMDCRSRQRTDCTSCLLGIGQLVPLREVEGSIVKHQQDYGFQWREEGDSVSPPCAPDLSTSDRGDYFECVENKALAFT